MKKVFNRRLATALCAFLMAANTFAELSIPASAESSFKSFTDNFESSQVGALPEGYISNYSDGNISVADYAGNKVLGILKSGDGQLSLVNRRFEKLTGVGVEISFDFRQNSVKSDATTVFALCDNGNEIIKLETANGNICFKNKDGNYENLVMNYLANRWYSFKLNIDLVNGKVNIEADGNSIIVNAPFTNQGNSCDSISFYTKISPGFLIDNLSVRNTEVTNSAVITGEDKVTVPISGKNTYEYSAEFFDDYGNKETDVKVDWEISPEIADGVKLIKNNDKVKLEISEDAVFSGMLKLTAFSVDNPSIRKSMDIMVTDSVISKIEIAGEAKLAYGLVDGNKFVYEYNMYDQYGVLQEDEELIFKIKEKSTEISVDSDGVITVHKPIEDEKHVTLVATYASNKNVYAEKKLTLIDLETYKDDEARMNILCDAIDNVIAYATDMYGGTPLLSSTVDLHTGKGQVYRDWDYTKPELFGQFTVMSNLTQDSPLFRAFDAATALTGEKRFSEKVDEIYQWYLDNGMNPYNLGHWGGHSYIDLLETEPHQAPGNESCHELKNTGFYFEPFFRLDPDRAYSIIKSIWGGHVGSEDRWKDLIANRHAYIDSARGPSIAGYTKFWDQPEIFDETSTEWVRDKENQPFRSIGDDLSTLAAIAYKETGDEVAKIWAYRIVNQYFKLRDPNTGIIPNMYSTGRGASGVKDPYVDDPLWYTKDDGTATGLTHVSYGDRFFNQFAEDLVKQGYYDSSALEPNDTRLVEGNYFNDSTHFESPVIHDLQLAQTLGDDTKEAQEIRRLQTINVAAYLKYAWIKGTAKVKPIMADGTSLIGFKPKKSGFFGDYYNKGGKMIETAIGVGLFPSVCACYDIARQDKAFAEQERIYWEYLQFFAPYYGLGKFGNREIGDEGMALNFATTASSPDLLMAVTDLYYATGNNEFLKLGRRIAENMISTYYKYGVFSANTTGIAPGQRYIVDTGAGNAIKYYSLCYLEAAIRGDKNLIPEYYPWDSFVEGYYEIGDYHEQKRTYISQSRNDAKYNAVEATDLIIDEVIYLKPGETKKLEYTLLPDDITNKSIVCESEDKSIVRVNKDTTSIIGVKKGVANLVVCSNEFNIIKNVKIIVSEEEQNEENN